ncbi:beta-lactamase family protein [Hymenobacter sp. BT188]|uniref:serine hydrolase domain-containing protein n=1 Tax=Hymenobacter sp. BT188 TaxID=2763504 RepID=UPI001651AB2B|nr:serine hydrolase domain-containing protein [Hymenobacter sp. BT188]MBC6605476.1 beta-lactamase family protein [Hymenobacter sp. BT188]
MKRLLLFLALLTPCFSAQAQRRPQPITTIPQLTDSIERIMRREHIPGLLLTMVTRDSVLFAGGLGLTNVEHKTPVTPHTLFRVGSVTKPFIVVGLLQLVEQGKLSLNDEVRKIAPEVPIDNPWEATDPVRVVHVLEHTAGFDDMQINHVYNTTPTDPRGAAAVQIFRKELRCRWRPGERMSYSNPGYLVAGYLLEKLSGEPYEHYLAKNVLRPLGMPDATAALRQESDPKLARGYVYDDGGYQPVPLLPIYAGPAGSMSASATDMAQWVQFFLRDFRTPSGTALLQPASLREMETVHSTLEARVGLQTGYGLASTIINKKGKAPFRGHNGGIEGFISMFAYNRELGLGYALSNNGSKPLTSISTLVRDFLLRDQPTPPTAPVLALDTAAIAPYLGHYQSAAPRNALTGFSTHLLGGISLERRGQLLTLQPLFSDPDTLMATGPLSFRLSGQTLPSVALTKDHDGELVLISPQGYALKAGIWWWLPPTLFWLSILLATTSSVAGLIWLIYALRKQLPRIQLLPRLLPLLATVALITLGFALGSLGGNVAAAGRVSIQSVLLFVAPLAFTVLTLWGLILTVRRFRLFRSRVVAWYLLLTYGALGLVATVLGTYGWLGLQLWSV